MIPLGRGDGPIPARVMVVGEAWGAEEDRLRTPFVGASGSELNRMLQEAGILRSECFVSNVVNARPPGNDFGAWVAERKKDITSEHRPMRDKMVLPIVLEGHQRLLTEIAAVKPNVIIACGNYSMWALSGNWGITKWRGSLLHLTDQNGNGLVPINDTGRNEDAGFPVKLIPTIHPASVLREWKQRAAVVRDLRRACEHMQSRSYVLPDWRFAIRPSLSQVIDHLQALYHELETGQELWIDLDLETSNGHIACCGLSHSRLDAICIPFTCNSSKEGYWSLDEETQIVWYLYKVLTHPRVRIRWQNGLYDAQYTHRDWGFVPRGYQDTMISHHALFSDLPKALYFQASMYAKHYVYWKDEGKQLAKGGSEEEHWRYNCEDCIYTREVGEVELDWAKRMNLEKVHQFQQAMFYPVLQAMLRGIKTIEANANALAGEIQEQISLREDFITGLLGHPLNINSSLQMCKLFYEDLKQPAIWSRPKKGQPAHITCDDEALTKIGQREPLLEPIVHSIADIRTLGKFLKDFILAKQDSDGRMRCSFNIGGSESGKSAPKTYRLSSSLNAFGSGANLQTIPSEKSKSVGKWEHRGHIALLGAPYQLPNLRSMFGPDPGFTFFDLDLDRADLQVMAWDADEPLLKEVCRRKVDVHLLNVYILDGKEPPPLEELVETHPKYPDHRGPRKHKREFAKVFCHATDYLGKARTVAAHTGRTVHEIESAQKIYLGNYRGIKKWQDKVIEQVRRHHFVQNAFGYRWYIFDRIDESVMPEAVAWIPQSTVSIVINRIWMNVFQDKPENEWDLSTDNLYHLLLHPKAIQVLLQVHDSLAGQFPTHLKYQCAARLQELSNITVPYDDPLIIPTGLATSDLSWGDCT